MTSLKKVCIFVPNKKINMNYIRGYRRSSLAYYASVLEKVEVSFGLYHPEGGSCSEMMVEWVVLDGVPCARLKVFEDAFAALASFGDLIIELGKVDGQEIQEPDFVKILDKCGFVDMTAYKLPNKPI